MRKNITRGIVSSLAVLGIGMALAACDSPSPAAGGASAAPAPAVDAAPATAGTAPSKSKPAQAPPSTHPAGKADPKHGGQVYIGDSNEPKVKPADLALAKDVHLTGIRWAEWGGEVAGGDGVLEVNTCEPDCASANYEKHAAHIVVAEIRTVGGKREYTNYTATFDGQDKNPELGTALTNQPLGQG
ncbi:hypothetical protein [Amycolatopsis minnesotensis]|uniref:Lipoprotein n=1 Tax=Amycolatopsis minnesotensis TaxID=337894 RepID=A0ABN2Q6S8_9PSEU